MGLARLYRRSMRAVRSTDWAQDHSRLFWWRPKRFVNFGDEIGPYLFAKITGRPPKFARPSDYSPRTVHTTVGSLLEHVKENCIVWGSGVIEGASTFSRPHEVHAVRGPLSRQRFLDQGYPCPAVFGDPSILLPRYYDPDIPKAFELGVAPNHVDQELAASLFGGMTGVQVIDLRDSVEAVVSKMLACEAIASTSLHGIIVAHAYGIPAAWIELSTRLNGDGSKFPDYYRTVGFRTVQPIDLKSRTISRSTLPRLRDAATLPGDWPDADALLAACPFKP